MLPQDLFSKSEKENVLSGTRFYRQDSAKRNKSIPFGCLIYGMILPSCFSLFSVSKRI